MPFIIADIKFFNSIINLVRNKRVLLVRLLIVNFIQVRIATKLRLYATIDWLNHGQRLELKKYSFSLMLITRDAVTLKDCFELLLLTLAKVDEL